jgi:AraC family ethanolamine operon transcriptional activator
MVIEINAYNDFDAFSRDVRDIDGQMLLKDTKCPMWTNRHIELCGVHVQIGSLGSGNIVEGKSSLVGYLVYMPLTQSCEHIVNGITLNEHSILVMEPGSDFCLSVMGPHEWCTIFVPKQKLVRYADSQSVLTVDMHPGCRVVRGTRQLVHQVRSLIRKTESAASIDSKFELTPAATIAAAEAVRIVFLIITERRHADPKREGRPRTSRQEIIRRCKELIEEPGVQRIKVEELANRAEVSERTLQAVFKEFFGVGPARYMQLRHLRQINIALQAAQSDGNTVAEILSRKGEWQFGRFAARYRRLFGESPSQTLQRPQH